MSKAMCGSCGDVIESKHRHDFVRCMCGESFIDGGEDYFRGGGMLIPVNEPRIATLAVRYKYRLEGKALEQERIIQILEENLGNVDFQQLIQLIKGEE